MEYDRGIAEEETIVTSEKSKSSKVTFRLSPDSKGNTINALEELCLDSNK